MPPLDQQAAHDLLHLDFALGCPGAPCTCAAPGLQLFLMLGVEIGRMHGSSVVNTNDGRTASGCALCCLYGSSPGMLLGLPETLE